MPSGNSHLWRYLGEEGENGIRVEDLDTGEEHVIEIKCRAFFTMDARPGFDLIEVHSSGWRTQRLPKRGPTHG